MNKTFLTVLLFISLISCKQELPESARSTYAQAMIAGARYYRKVIIPFSSFDSSTVFKLPQDSLMKLRATYDVNKSIWDKNDREVKELEKLHPEFSDTKTSKDYLQFVIDSIIRQSHYDNMKNAILFGDFRNPEVKF